MTALYTGTSTYKPAGGVTPNNALLDLQRRLTTPDPTDVVTKLWGADYQGLGHPLIAMVRQVDGMKSRGLGHADVAAVAVIEHPGGNAIISHELGHVLGVDGPDEGHPNCFGNPGLMCKNRATNGPIFGCHDWRAGTEREKIAPCSGPVCTPSEIDVPLGCDPVAGAAVAVNVCDVAREAAASYGAAFSGNLATELALTELDGTPVEDQYSCGGDISFKRVIEHDFSDVAPHVHPRRGGWTVTYFPSPGLLPDIITYGPEVDSVTVDLDLHPDWPVEVTFTAIDVQAKRSTAFERFVTRDFDPPVISELPPVNITECASSELRILSPPVSSGVDNCGVVDWVGSIVALNGNPLPAPIPIDPGGNVFDLAGTYEIAWVAVDGSDNESEPAVQLVNVQPCLAAGSAFLVHNGVSVTQEDGSPMPILTLGNGETNISGNSVVGPVRSQAPVRVEGGATVDGDIESGGAITVQSGAAVQGDVLEHQVLTLPSPPSISGSFPSVCDGARRYWADSGVQDLPPGCYEELYVGSRTTVRLDNGRYFFHRVVVEPQGKLRPQAGTVFDVRWDFTFRGEVLDEVKEAAHLAIQLRSSNTFYVESPIYATIVAPLGTLVLGGTNGQVFRGRYYADRVELRSGIQLVVSSSTPSSPWMGAMTKAPGAFATMKVDRERLSPRDEPFTELQPVGTGCALASASRGPIQTLWFGLFLGIGLVSLRRRTKVACKGRSRLI